MKVKKRQALRFQENNSVEDRGTWVMFKNQSGYLYSFIFISISVFLLSLYSLFCHDTEESFSKISRVKKFAVFEENTNFLISSQPLIKTSQFETNDTVFEDQCSGLRESDRFDCYPQQNVSEDACRSRGCCWIPGSKSSKVGLGVPNCFYPSKFRSYRYLNISSTEKGKTAYLEKIVSSPYPRDVQLVKIDFNYIDENILQVKIYDAKMARFESPLPKISTTGGRAKDTFYQVNIYKDKLGFSVIRKSSNQSIFNTEDIGGFIFADQLLQLSARLPSQVIYGLGYQHDNFLLDTNWSLITLFNRDKEPVDHANLYATHPFYLAVEDGGLASGVLLLNTNAMDIILQPTPAITYRTIGGILDFNFFLGPTPADVISQYTGLVGRPFMPPYWSLGFHLCRFGYQTLNETMSVWNRTRNAGIPLDTQWNDIDYMDGRKDFTYNLTTFKGLPDFVNLLHKEGMHYMIIIDPGLSPSEPPGTYPPYDQGLKEGLFLKHPTEDRPFIGQVWRQPMVFPDFFNPNTEPYWIGQIEHLQNKFAFDGLWIDMNEPSNEVDGEEEGCPCNTLEDPPYLPSVQGGVLYSRTACMSARHYGGVVHYNLHNIYGTQESILTVKAMKRVRNKRAFVISRASFPGQGHLTGVWTGDIDSTWGDMVHSISDILSFSLFGIPMSGADICGFNQNTTVPLCKRWSQLGAFYPFSRNHNSVENFDQDPVALGPEVVEAARKSLLTRYMLLPYLYTLFWHAHTKGETVARPMFVEFPKDINTYSLHSQFLWGSGLLIAPVLTEGASYTTAYLPRGRWYDFYSFKQIDSEGSEYLLTTADDSIPLVLRGGRIIPTQEPNTTTTASRLNHMGLLVSLCERNTALGDLYWDDGDSYGFEDGSYNYVTFKATAVNVTSTVEQWRYKTSLTLGEVKVLGLAASVSKVTVNGKPVNFTYQPDVKLLDVKNLSLDMGLPFTISWE